MGSWRHRTGARVLPPSRDTWISPREKNFEDLFGEGWARAVALIINEQPPPLK